ncbi:MAG: proteasome assembly chaperone 4 family protein [Candidatus Bathyarchaeota archaeon]|nr:proteasome assembly chaperone 4 family protein [Candidatus Bathyarchaeota archaeon]
MSLQFSTESIEVEGKTLNGALTELENAVLLLVWMGDKPKLGSLTVTVPDRTSSQLLGDRDEVLSRMVGERLASRYGKLILVSSNLPIDFQAGRELLDLINRLVGEIDE